MRAFKWIFLCFPLVCFAISDKQFNEVCQKQRRVSTNLVKSSVTGFDNSKSLKLSKNNGDQSRYTDLRGNFNKALKHQANGFPVNAAYSSLLKALTSGSPKSFLNIILGIGTVKLVNPQGSFAYSLAANDSWLNSIPPAPKFASNQAAAEMVEVYWTALCRDVPFNMFSTNGTALDAIDDLNTLVDFYGPKVGGLVTPGTYLRGNTTGDLIGPYISQFFYQTVPYGSTTIPPEQTVPKGTTANDFNTTFADWFTVINGGLTGAVTDNDPVMHFIRTPRDLAAYVHSDAPGQVYYNALRILDSYGPAALDSNNPYRSNATQFGFVSYGISQIFQLLTDGIAEALKAAWFHKWQVNRRLRPEEYGFYVQKQKADGLDLGIASQLINSPALDAVYALHSTYFLPQAYPEGCPTHPSYPAGHAALSGAAATILKAFFNENYAIPSPLMPSSDNTVLEAYPGTLRVGDELNKLAANVSLGRDHAGVHYRSDGFQGMLLGEKVAIDILNNSAFLFNEDFKGFHLTKFDGTKIIVGKSKKP